MEHGVLPAVGLAEVLLALQTIATHLDDIATALLRIAEAVEAQAD